MPEKDMVNQVLAGALKQLGEHMEFVRNFNPIPPGQVKLTPREVKERYGMGVRQMEQMEQQYGADALREALAALRFLQKGK